MDPRLKNNEGLERSEVVANSTMNRERGVSGTNSYTRDLSFDVLSFLTQRSQVQGSAFWLDLCCGSGKALIEAGTALKQDGLEEQIQITGVDLVPMFYPVPKSLPFIRLEAASLHRWEPDRRYDLITCVHGLHYIGDKLGLIRRAVSWLSEEGVFLAHLDPANLRLDASPSTAPVLKMLHRTGLTYDRKNGVITARGRKELNFDHAYVGADDGSGPNATGQPAVTSYYTTAE